MKTYNKIIALVAAGLACSAITSHAALAPLANGGSAVPPATTPIFGALLASTTQSYSFGGGTDTGTIESLVYASDTQAANTLGGYAFEYIVKVTTGDIAALNLNGFGGIASLLVGYVVGPTPGTSIAPATIGLATGIVNVHFVTGTPLTAGQTSTILIDTAVNTYGANNTGIQDNFPDGGAVIYAPVPEPTTIAAGALMLLPFGIGALRSLRKDRVA
jgi:hypothetical protein